MAVLLYRAPIDSDFWSPLHHACYENQTEMVKFMVEKEKEVMNITSQNTSIHAGNIKDWRGWTPVFYAKSKDVIEAMLHLDNLEVVNPYDDNLLWKCFQLGLTVKKIFYIVSGELEDNLRTQLGMRTNGMLPLEEGENDDG